MAPPPKDSPSKYISNDAMAYNNKAEGTGYSPVKDSEQSEDSSSAATPPPKNPRSQDSTPASSPPKNSPSQDSPDNSSDSAAEPPPPSPSPPPPSPSPPPSSQKPSPSPPPPPSPQQQQQQQQQQQHQTPPPQDNGNFVPPPRAPPHSPIPLPLSEKTNNTRDSSPRKESPNKQNDSPNNNKMDGKMTGIVIAGIAIGAVVLIIFMIICFTRCINKRKRRRQQKQYHPIQEPYKGDVNYNSSQNPPYQMQQQQNYSGQQSSNFSGGPYRPPMPPPSPSFVLGLNNSTFTYEELVTATSGFSEANLLGQGGFGYVHKGVLPTGKVVAVKSLKSGSGQGLREFSAEVEIISRVHHRHLVSLVGYCISNEQRMLVYEFVPNNTLEHHLHGNNLQQIMDFSTRLQVALGSAKGLAYLHEDCEPRIIHRDIKAANILIDDHFEAKVADFGLARLSSDTNTHVSTRVMGTFGYMAPEYAASGKLTEKSDVFSFGVVLLELITGRRPINPISDEDSLVDWARPLLTRAMEDGNYEELADSRLQRNFNHQEMRRMVECAAASTRHSARKRPKMSQIIRTLEGDSSLEDLNEGVKPGQSTIFSAAGMTAEYNASNYNEDMKKFRQLIMPSQDFSGASSEYGASRSSSRDMPGN